MNCSEWEEVKIKEICSKIVSGGTPSRKNPHFFINGLHRWLKTQELKDTNIYETEEHITDEALLNSSAKICPVNTVSMAMYGATVGKLGILKKECSTNQACCNLVVNDAIADYRFLFYQLLNHRESLISLSNGAAQQNLNLRVISDYKINIPSLLEQRLISELLSCLDDKIELNNRINKNLEEMAQAIFKRWFVDFEFPDENGNPYKSSGGEMVESELGDIPKGWQIKGLDNIASYLNGLAMQKYRPETNDFLRVIKIKELGQECTDENSDKASANISEEYIIHNGDVIFSWSGTLLIKIWTGGTGALNQHLFKVSSTVYDKWFYYLWTLKYLEDFKSIAKDKATTMGHIKRIHLTNSKVLVPNNSELNMMNDIMNPIIDHMTGIKIQNQTLQELRDSLLPKLMSGEIRVPCEEAV